MGPVASVVDEVDVGVHAFARAGHPHQGADGLGHPPPAADHASHVAGSDVDAKAGGTARVVGLYDDRVGLGGDVAGDVVEHHPGPAAVYLVADAGIDPVADV